MSALTISAGSLRLPGRGDAGTGTPAEQAVQRAQKAYAQAVERLRTDALRRADEQVVKVDQTAVDLAASALAQAQAALAREQRRAAGKGDPTAAASAVPVADRVEVTTRGAAPAGVDTRA